MGDIAPKMAELTDNVLYGDIWERPELSKRDRSLITVAALVAMNHPDQLRSHLDLARRNVGADRDDHTSGVLQRVAELCDCHRCRQGSICEKMTRVGNV